MSEGGAEKEHDPTPKKLEDARLQGDFARSADLNTAAGYGGFLLAALAIGSESLTQLGTLSMVLLDQADSFAPVVLSGETGPVAGLLLATLMATAPWFLVPGGGALLAVLAQQSLVFTPKRVMPKLSRLSPLATAKQKFGREGLFEFFKSLLKLLVYSGILGMFLIHHMPRILASMALTPAMATAELLHLLVQFLLLIVVVSASLGALDYLWQRHRLVQRNKMSRQDLLDEHKQSEGDPHLKQQRRQRGYEIATSQMITDVPKADVIIVNPTHYAVALKWQRGTAGAPVCIAKGADGVAARIREAAAVAGIPVHSDPATARALYASVRVGQEIRPDQYRAVAAAIRFAEKMRAKARARR